MALTDLPSTRKAAVTAGSARYYTGKPCKHGHTSPRLTDTGACTSCNSISSRDYTRRIQVQRKAANDGMKPLTVMVHPDDVDNVTEYAAALGIARGMA